MTLSAAALATVHHRRRAERLEPDARPSAGGGLRPRRPSHPRVPLLRVPRAQEGEGSPAPGPEGLGHQGRPDRSGGHPLGNADDSLLVRRVLGLDGEDRMPKDKDRLPDAQVSLLRAWIAQGAPWPDDGPMAAGAAAPEEDLPEHWVYGGRCVRRLRSSRTGAGPKSHRRVRRHPPRGKDSSRRPRRDRATLIRRLSLDPSSASPRRRPRRSMPSSPTPPPTPTSASSIGCWPRRTTASAGPRHWLDLARYADSNGYQKDGRAADLAVPRLGHRRA